MKTAAPDALPYSIPSAWSDRNRSAPASRARARRAGQDDVELGRAKQINLQLLCEGQHQVGLVQVAVGRTGIAASVTGIERDRQPVRVSSGGCSGRGRRIRSHCKRFEVARGDTPQSQRELRALPVGRRGHCRTLDRHGARQRGLQTDRPTRPPFDPEGAVDLRWHDCRLQIKREPGRVIKQRGANRPRRREWFEKSGTVLVPRLVLLLTRE